MLDYSKAVDLYISGLSIEQVADQFNVTRQSMWDTLRRRGVEFRKKEPNPFVMLNGEKYSLSKDGYYRCTTSRHVNKMLHQEAWRLFRGEIPDGWDIHHKYPNDKATSDPDRLECLSPEDHTRLYSSKKRLVTFRGRTMYIRQWANELGITPSAMGTRLDRWPLERAMTEASNRAKSSMY